MFHDEIYIDEEPLTNEERWAVGLFEGEGCMTISAGYPRMKLNSTDEDVVMRFYRAVDCGQVREERTHEVRGYKRQWEWYTGSRDDVGRLLVRFFHYMGIRRRSRAEELLLAFANKD